MAEETKPVEMTPPASTWDKLMSQCHGGIPYGELTVMIARSGTGKSRLTEYVKDKIAEERANGVR